MGKTKGNRCTYCARPIAGTRAVTIVDAKRGLYVHVDCKKLADKQKPQTERNSGGETYHATPM